MRTTTSRFEIISYLVPGLNNWTAGDLNIQITTDETEANCSVEQTTAMIIIIMIIIRIIS